MATLREIYLAEKEIGYFPGWSKPEEDTEYVWFDAPIEIDGFAETGLVLHGGCIANRPNVNVSFELRISRTVGKQCIPIERLDWRSLEGGHTNRRKPKSDWSGKRVSDTHLHDFFLNWSDAEGRMRKGGLNVARDINNDLNGFGTVLNYVGKRLKINNIDIVQPPPWVYDLFSEGF